MDWIKMHDALPTPLVDVLVVTKAGCLDDEPSIDIAFRRDDGTWILMGSDPYIVIEPLRWMPLPALPFDIADEQES